MIEVRFHGRGGQGVKLASRILGRSGFFCGLQVQDFALFGAERRGAPVASFVRLSSDPIAERGYIDRPILIVVMDSSLLKEPSAQLFQGIDDKTPFFVNGDAARFEMNLKELPAARFLFVDLSAIARKLIGEPFVSAEAAEPALRTCNLQKRSAIHRSTMRTDQPSVR